MELSKDHEGAIIRALVDEEDGLDFTELFDSANIFEERRELSMALHAMIQQGTVYKRGEQYFATDLSATPKPAVAAAQEASDDDDEDTESDEAENIPPVSKRVESIREAANRIAAASTKMPPKFPVLKQGNLRRTIGNQIAFVLYRYRNEDYSLPVSRIKDSLRDQPTGLYKALLNLTEAGYIKRFGTGRATSYKWSGEYKYPFADVRAEDETYCKILPKSERGASSLAISMTIPGKVEAPAVVETDEKEEKKILFIIPSDPVAEFPVTASQSLPTSPANTPHCSPSLAAIDAQIQSCKEHLSFLQELRATMLRELCAPCKKSA